MSFFDRLNELPKNKTKEELDAHFEKIDLEKGDMLAMVLAGLATLLPILIVLGLITLAVMKFFRAI